LRAVLRKGHWGWLDSFRSFKQECLNTDDG
jgi:hypothetical protein